MDLKSYLIPVITVVVALVIYHMWVAKALKITAYEQAYERNAA